MTKQLDNQTPMITIMVDGMNENVPEGISISELIRMFNELDPSLIIDLNHRAVLPQDYETTIVAEGDRLEFIHPNIGG